MHTSTPAVMRPTVPNLGPDQHTADNPKNRQLTAVGTGGQFPHFYLLTLQSGKWKEVFERRMPGPVTGMTWNGEGDSLTITAGGQRLHLNADGSHWTLR